MLPLVPELLSTHPFFDTAEPDMDDPACILCKDKTGKDWADFGGLFWHLFLQCNLEGAVLGLIFFISFNEEYILREPNSCYS